VTPAGTALAGLRSQRPEWAPWLAVVEETLRDADSRAWDAAVPQASRETGTATPLLSGAEVAVDVHAVRDVLHRLIDVAARSRTPQMATLRAVLDGDPDLLVLFKASLCRDTATITEIARSCAADAGAFEAVIALAAVPFLQACNRRWAAVVPPGWREGYCAVCGAWPAFAEVRGIERSRVFRCGRCGGGWHARPLRCPYCGVDDHNTLVSLVPEGGGSNAVIEGCRSCLGYVKTFSRLQGCAPGVVMVDDLASVHLDVAALEQGFVRPSGPGHPLNLTVLRQGFGWTA
jgi:FdhE protein